MNERNDDKRRFKAVVNDEGQYSIWPEARENALGWKDAGRAGSKDDCLEFIGQVWTDMRPMSLRRKMDAQNG